MAKRVFLIVLDSMGIGEMPDANEWHDEGSNTLAAIRNHPAFNCPVHGEDSKAGYKLYRIGRGNGTFSME